MDTAQVWFLLIGGFVLLLVIVLALFTNKR
jgi:LPXTG-motif cell wall-anchored protein